MIHADQAQPPQDDKGREAIGIDTYQSAPLTEFDCWLRDELSNTVISKDGENGSRSVRCTAELGLGI